MREKQRLHKWERMQAQDRAHEIEHDGKRATAHVEKAQETKHERARDRSEHKHTQKRAQVHSWEYY